MRPLAGRSTDTRPRTAALAAALTACLIVLAGGAGDPAVAGPPERPNVVVIMTDDQNLAQMTPEYMPKTMRLLGGRGSTRFTRSFVSSPLCCPSRAGTLTGAYPHNNGVHDNTPGYGALIEKDQTLFTWLQAAGYRTGHIGRFLLNYDSFSMASPNPGAPPPAAPPAPPGVDYWFGYATGYTFYFSAPFSDNGVPLRTAADRSGYVTRVISRRAREFVRASAPSPDPFFLWVAQLAPHTSNAPPRGPCSSGAAAVEAGTYRAYRDEPLPQPPSFGERANRDKPTWIRSRPPLRRRAVKALTKAWRCSLASLTSVDRGVAHLVRELKRSGELDNTAIFFTSDNGYLYGEHRVVLEKIYPYEESWRVPLLSRLPSAHTGGGPAPRFVKQNVTNLDLTATILDLADAGPCNQQGECRRIDGRSLLPLLGAPGPRWPADRAVLAEIGNGLCGTLPVRGLKNYYDAIRTRRFSYVEINRVNPRTGECDRPEYELYDLRSDPYQLKNAAVNPASKTPPGIQVELAERLHTLARCTGAGGRDAPVTDADGVELPLCE